MTTCRDCERRWGGVAECHCPSCHRHFSSVSPFETHRMHGRCADPLDVGLARRDRLDGVVWVTSDERPHFASR